MDRDRREQIGAAVTLLSLAAMFWLLYSAAYAVYGY